MFNVNARGITIPNVVVGMAIFSGGLVQFIAGMWEYPRGNVFGATGACLFFFLCYRASTAHARPAPRAGRGQSASVSRPARTSANYDAARGAAQKRAKFQRSGDHAR